METVLTYGAVAIAILLISSALFLVITLLFNTFDDYDEKKSKEG